MLNSTILKKMKATDDLLPNQAMDLITKNNQDLLILDVSTKKEFKNRHLENAVNHSLISRSFKSVIKTLDKTKTYLVYCTIGGRSKIATKQMKKAGFQNVYNLIGGTLLWEEYKYPFAKDANNIKRFSICPALNTILILKKVKTLFSKGATRKKKMEHLCSDPEKWCDSKNMLLDTMAECCSGMFDSINKMNTGKK